MTDSLPSTRNPATRGAPTLKAAREAKELTQQRLAEITGLSIGSIREWEQGVRTTLYTRTWNKLCDALDVPVEVGFHGLHRVFNK